VKYARRKPRILVLGSTGMLGSAVFNSFSNDPAFDVFGTTREDNGAGYFTQEVRRMIIPNVRADGESALLRAFSVAKPDVVINCIGIIKQLPSASDCLEAISVNSMLPHRLAKFSQVAGARLVHFSTDCVFSGAKGQYKEEDVPDAYDLYGRTKLLGEVDYENAITLRTSIIGHELSGTKSLIGWFLNQKTEVRGFTKAIFSGLPTVEVARVIKEFVIPRPQLKGVYHLSVDPISKFDLLSIVAEIYNKKIKISPDDNLVIDRSLNSDRFRVATGFVPKAWRELILNMYRNHIGDGNARSDFNVL
jgi:dTDP-4-dehydrorhamnose reductase